MLSPAPEAVRPHPATSRIRVVLVCGQTLIRAALRLAVEDTHRIAVVAEADTLANASALAKTLEPDVLLVDLDSVEGWREALESDLLGPSILFLAGEASRELVREVVRAGGCGIVLKACAVETLRKAVERVHAGEAWFDRSAVADALAELRRPAQEFADGDAARVGSLTTRERDIVRCVAEGLDNKEIAGRLFISDVTVRHHLTSIFSKLDVPNRKRLMLFAFRNNLAVAPTAR